MAKRFAVGETGWIEVSRDVQNAAFQISGEEHVSVNEAIQGLMTGEYDPSQFGLSESGEESDDSDD